MKSPHDVPSRPPAWRIDPLASAVRVSRRTIERAIERGDLRTVKRGGIRYIPDSAVRAYFGEDDDR
jgi:excisionase family DNA binding protein